MFVEIKISLIKLMEKNSKFHLLSSRNRTRWYTLPDNICQVGN